MASTKSTESTTSPTPSRARSRLRWLVIALVLLVVVAAFNRDFLASLPNSYARRSLNSHDVDAAEQWVDFAQRIAAGNAQSFYLQARIHRRRGEYDRAERVRQQAVHAGWAEQSVKHEEYLTQIQQGRFRDPLSDMETLLNEAPWDSVEICRAFVAGALARREYTLALKLTAFWMSQHPDDPLPHLHEAETWHTVKEWETAEGRYQTVLKLSPGDGRALIGLGKLKLDQNNVAEALALYQQARAAGDSADEATVGEVRCLRLLGKTGEALQLVEELLAESPQSPGGRLELAELELSDGKYREALSRLRAVKRDLPHDPDVMQATATALRGTGDTDAARQAFKDAAKARVELDRATQLLLDVMATPEDLDKRQQIGAIYLQYGTEEEAMIWLSGVLRMHPLHVGTLCALAEYYEMKREDDSRYIDLAINFRNRCNAATARAAQMAPAPAPEPEPEADPEADKPDEASDPASDGEPEAAPKAEDTKPADGDAP